MKNLLCLCLVVMLLAFGLTTVKADNELGNGGAASKYSTDFMAQMLICSGSDSPESLKLGAFFEQMRNEKIAVLQLPYSPTSFFETYDTAAEINCAIRDQLGLSHKVLVNPAYADSSGVPDEEPVKLTVTATLLNCRAAPDSSSKVIKKFTFGKTVQLLETSSGWFRVTDGEISGWCWGSYLSEQAQSPAAATYTQDDLYWLALAITMEAGSNWLSDEHQLLVGNVILNRVASGIYPNTIYGVIHQRGQYPWAGYSSATPSQRAYANATRLLEGERFCPANVLYQAQFRQGNGVFTSIYDTTLNSTTYFCYS